MDEAKKAESDPSTQPASPLGGARATAPRQAHKPDPLMRLALLIKKHPLVTLLSAVAAIIVPIASIIGPTVSVSTWFSSQVTEQRVREATAPLHKTNEDLRKTNAELRNTNEDLELRLKTIQRRVGGEELYLDISEISIDPQEVTALPPLYKSYLKGAVLVVPPTEKGWVYQPASQMDFMRTMFGDSFMKEMRKDPNFAGVEPLLSHQNGALWRSTSSIKIPLSKQSVISRTTKISELNSYPAIFVMRVDGDVVRRLIGAPGKMSDDASADSEALPQSLKEQSNPTRRDEASVEDRGEAVGSTNAHTPVSDAERSSEKEAGLVANANYLEKLEESPRTDLAGFLLGEALMSQATASKEMGAALNVIAAEKKGNVFYARFQLTFPEVQLPNSTDASVPVIDQELLYIGTTTGGVLVRVLIPSYALRNPQAYGWTQKWLSSLRVSLN